MAERQTARRIQQDALGREETDAPARGTKPVELVICRENGRTQGASGDGKARLWAGLSIFERGSTLVLRDHQTVESIIQADTQDVVGDVRAVVGGKKATAWTCDRRNK
jgi:hypothetical protein